MRRSIRRPTPFYTCDGANGCLQRTNNSSYLTEQGSEAGRDPLHGAVMGATSLLLCLVTLGRAPTGCRQPGPFGQLALKVLYLISVIFLRMRLLSASIM